MDRPKFLWLVAVSLLLSLATASAEEGEWPRTVPLEQGTLTVYAPQVDEYSDDTVRFRAALAYRETPDAEPVFGAGWFESDVVVDQFSRTVHPVDLKVLETRFPDGTDDVTSMLARSWEHPSSSREMSFTLDELETSLEVTRTERQASESLNTTPPKIIYRDKPALLVTLDGQPVLREIENSKLEAVINTPYPLIRDGRRYYLNVAQDVWYQGPNATGPFRFDADPPNDIVAMVGADKSADLDQPVEPITASNAPEIVVSTEPAELIVTEGPAAFVPLVDDLLVLQNSDDDVFMHLSEQEYYIVLAGRWYRSASLNGPWSYQAADDLPVAFANIPQESSQADSRVYVAGTEEALDAIKDAQVPQTAAVQRGQVDIDVQYDGDPQFAPVDGAELVYASNTGSTVIESGGLYYLVEDGVWYVSASPTGPWQVSTQRPAQVVDILPTSPVYNVKYVHVYHSTPNVVYVGYTPGYLGSYVYHNTVVYGSGWYYQPWVSPYYYYPRHSTWGFHVTYNPWYGWGFGLSWGWGPFGLSYWTGGYWHHHHNWHHRYHGYWGPRGYRPRYRHHRPRHYGGHRVAQGGHRQEPYRDNNLYRDSGQRARVVDSRDKYRSGREGRYDTSTLANASAVRMKQKQGYVTVKDLAAPGKTPIKRSEIRGKARTQEATFAASQQKMLAASSRKSYQKVISNPVNVRSRQKSAVTAGQISKSRGAVASNSKQVTAKRKQPAIKSPVREPLPKPDFQRSRPQPKVSNGSVQKPTKPARRSYQKPYTAQPVWKQKAQQSTKPGLRSRPSKSSGDRQRPDRKKF